MALVLSKTKMCIKCQIDLTDLEDEVLYYKNTLMEAIFQLVESGVCPTTPDGMIECIHGNGYLANPTSDKCKKCWDDYFCVEDE